MALIDQGLAHNKTVFGHLSIHSGPIEIPRGEGRLPVVFDLFKPRPLLWAFPGDKIPDIKHLMLLQLYFCSPQ